MSAVQSNTLLGNLQDRESLKGSSLFGSYKYLPNQPKQENTHPYISVLNVRACVDIPLRRCRQEQIPKPTTAMHRWPERRGNTVKTGLNTPSTTLTLEQKSAGQTAVKPLTLSI